MHAVWKGAISFGLVNIPISMYTASHEKEISFKLLHQKDNAGIHYARICEAEQKEVPWNEIVKGYEIEKGQYVIFDEKDFEKANLKKTKTIEILNFIEEEEIDTIFYIKPYFLEPDKNADKAYHLLREALRQSRKVGLAKFVLHNREHLAVLKFHENMLILNEIRYENELLLPQDLKIPAAKKLNAKEIEIAIQLIDQLTIPFKPEKYHDTYVEEIKRIVKQKAKGQKIQPAEEEAIKSPKVQDIMSLLQASLKRKKKPPPPPKRSKKTA